MVLASGLSVIEGEEGKMRYMSFREKLVSFCFFLEQTHLRFVLPSSFASC